MKNSKKKIDENTLLARTYEKGVEDETYSCGTGAIAIATASSILHKMQSPVKIKTKYGYLLVFYKNYQKTITNVRLASCIKKPFSGRAYL